MKKIKLNTSTLMLKKEEISNLTSTEMRHVVGGEAAITDQCATASCQNCNPSNTYCNTGYCNTPDPGTPLPGNNTGNTNTPTAQSHHC